MIAMNAVQTDEARGCNASHTADTNGVSAVTAKLNASANMLTIAVAVSHSLPASVCMAGIAAAAKSVMAVQTVRMAPVTTSTESEILAHTPSPTADKAILADE